MPPQTSTQFGEGGDDIDIADIVRSLRRHWRVIAYVAAAGTLLAMFLVLTATPMFSVDGSLYFGDSQAQRPANTDGVNLLTDFQSLNDVPTEVALIQSRALIEQAILETGLNVSVQPPGNGGISYWKWRFEDHQEINAFAPGPDDLTVLYATLSDPGSGGGAFLLKFGTNGTYQLFKSDGDGPVILTGTLNQPAAGNGLTMMVKPAADNATPAAGRRYKIFITPAKSLAERLIGSNLKVVQGGQVTDPTQTADVHFSWNNPYQGQIFVNQLMKDFIATQLTWKTESASDIQQFISQQLQNIQSSLSDADSKLAAYQASTGIVDVPANAQAVINQLSQYEVQRTTAMLQQQALQQLVASTAKPAPGLNPYLVTQSGDPVLAQLAGNLATAEVLLRTQSLQFTPSSPELQAQQETVNRTEQAIKTLLENDETLAAGNVKNLNNLISKYEAELKGMPAQSLQVNELARASTVYGQLYVLLMQNEEEAQVSKAATIVNTRIVSPAEVPLSATSPKGSITVLTGFILGLMLGTMIVLVRRVLSGRFHTESDVQRTYPFPIFGLIPARSRSEIVAGVLPQRSTNAFAEAFRLLRSRVYQTFNHDQAGARVILITSASAKDGKTTIAVNLAKSIGDDGKRVLLVDGDLHRGHLHEALNILQAPGLSELLAGRESSRPQPVPGQNFWALSSGAFAANPPHLLKDATLAKTLDVLKTDFDFIIIDCPPLPSVVDTLTFAKFADLILSVIYLDRTFRVAFNAHSETLRSTDVQRGLVVNGLIAGPHYRQSAYADLRNEASLWHRFSSRRAE